MQKYAEQKNQKEKSESFQMKCFFVCEREGNKYARNKCNNSEKDTRELHLELGGDIVTYVRVY